MYLSLDDVRTYVEGHIPEFHESRRAGLEKLSLEGVLKRKNPYLYKAKNVLFAQDLLAEINSDSPSVVPGGNHLW